MKLIGLSVFPLLIENRRNGRTKLDGRTVLLLIGYFWGIRYHGYTFKTFFIRFPVVQMFNGIHFSTPSFKCHEQQPQAALASADVLDVVITSTRSSTEQLHCYVIILTLATPTKTILQKNKIFTPYCLLQFTTL